MKRADIRNIFPDATDEQLTQLLTAIHAEIDSVKDDRDALKDEIKDLKDATKNNADSWESKYNAEHKAFEAFKANAEAEKSKAKKLKAFKKFLEDKDLGLSSKGQAKALKYTDLASVEIDEDGDIKSRKALFDSIKSEWADYIEESNESGTRSKDGNNGGGSTLTKAEIMAIKNTSERQKAIMENSHLFT